MDGQWAARAKWFIKLICGKRITSTPASLAQTQRTVLPAIQTAVLLVIPAVFLQRLSRRLLLQTPDLMLTRGRSPSSAIFLRQLPARIIFTSLHRRSPRIVSGY